MVEGRFRILTQLAAGRWTVVHDFESGGRRYIVAERIDSASRTETELSLRERQVLTNAALGCSDKEIAQSLGIAQSTVRVLLARARKKLGATTRAELVQRFEAANGVNTSVQPAGD